jgi:hypothetical protein
MPDSDESAIERNWSLTVGRDLAAQLGAHLAHEVLGLLADFVLDVRRFFSGRSGNVGSGSANAICGGCLVGTC